MGQSEPGWRRRYVWVAALVVALLTSMTLTGAARAVVTSCPAGSDHWVGGQMAPGDTTPNNWNVAANWSTDAVPTAATDVCLDNTDAAGSYTVNVDTYGAGQALANSITVGGTAPGATVTLALLGVGGGVQVASPLTLTNASAGAGVLPTGAITLGSLPDNLAGGQPGIITVQSGTLVSQGTITSQPFDNPGAANTISGGFDNEGTLNVVQNLNSNGPDVSGATVNISAGETWHLDYSSSDASFTQTGGTINTQGTFLLDDGTFTASAGTTIGNPLSIGSDNSGVNIDLAGTATDSVHSQTGGANLTGDIGAGDTLWASGEPGYTQGALFVQGAYTNRGTLQLGAGGTDRTQGNVTAKNGTFTNVGTLISVNNVDGGPNAINGPFVNAGTMSLQGSLSGTGQITNQGAIALAPGMVISGASFAQASPGTLSVGIAAGSSALQNPVVDLTGAASLGGGLSVATSGTQTAGVTLVAASAVTGTFPSPQFTGQSYGVLYGPKTVTLTPGATVTPPPTPPTPAPTPKPKTGAKAKIGPISSSGGALSIKLSCAKTAACAATTIKATVTEKVKRAKGKTKVITVGSARTQLAAGKSRTVTLKLNHAGTALLKGHKALKVAVTISSGGKIVKRTTADIKAASEPKQRKHKRAVRLR